MKADIFYSSVTGRMFMKIIQKSGAFKIAAAFLRSGASKYMISSFIRKNSIDMSDFKGQSYRSFAEFFSRKKKTDPCVAVDDALVSPCDSLLSVYEIDGDMQIPMKGSLYRISDLIPDDETAKIFKGGLCMIFRLEASDYHHFCACDDLKQGDVHFIPGELHSVQPIACERFPVYRLNRRWWSVLDTEHFGFAAQIEIGAMIVGGVKHIGENKRMKKGEDMGNFELAGSTIALLFTENMRKRFDFLPHLGREDEVRVKIGEVIGKIRDE